MSDPIRSPLAEFAGGRCSDPGAHVARGIRSYIDVAIGRAPANLRTRAPTALRILQPSPWSDVIISHKLQFVFVKTAKTAGTSLETFLSPHCGPDDVLTPFVGPEPGHEPRNYRGTFDPWPELRIRRRAQMGMFRRTLRDLAMVRRFEHHTPAWTVRERAPREWSRYLTFCVVRNPWDVVLSGHEYHQRVSRAGVDLDAFLAGLRVRAARRDRGVGRWPFNYWNYVDPLSGEVLVDRILRYERLDEELGVVMRDLGIPFDGLPRSGKVGSARRAQLSPSHVDQIAELYADEIALHGYAYEGSS